MRIYIDTRDNTKTIVGLDGKKLEKPTGVDKSQQVLSLIEQILKKHLPRRKAGKKTLKNITEIKVETGTGLPAGRQGSFTGLKVGVAVANALSWALGIKVNGKDRVEPKYD